MRSLNGSILPMATLLPAATRDALVAASKVESRIDAGISPERTAAVEAAVAAARNSNPQFFNEEK